MSDSIKFGPEWLRNMSNDTGSLSSGTATAGAGGGGGNNFSYTNSQTRYPLAEYRYGREEMLSLYDKNFKLPELLPKFNKLFIEKMQSPLALLPPTADEETPRGLTPIGGISSERSGLGISSNSSSGSVLGGVSSATIINSLGISGRGIRGSSIDRGRGRARGGLYHSSLGNYQRSGFTYDEDARGAGTRGERSWSERNGSATSEAEWNATANSGSSPRKDFSSLRSGSNSGESWRRSRVEEDGQLPNGAANEGWRTSASTNNSSYKWPVRSTSWRGGDGDANANSAFNSDGTGGPPRLERSKSTQGSVGSREHPPDGVPLRRFANASWDEDNLPEWAMEDPIEGGGSFDATGAFLGNVDKITGEKLKSNDTTSTDGHIAKCDEKSDTTSLNGGNEKDHSLTDTSDNNNLTEDEVLLNSRPNDEETLHKEKSNKNDSKELNSISHADHHHHQQQQQHQHHHHHHHHHEAKLNEDTVPEIRHQSHHHHHHHQHHDKSAINLEKVINSLPTDRMQEVAEDIEKLIMDDDQSCAESDDHVMLPTHSHKHSNADDVLSEKAKEKELSDLWYYRDPQRKIQGPFTATEMLEWYRAGYFDETLNVRRVCDPDFIELGELLKVCSGTIPFVSMPIIPQSLLPSSSKSDINLNATANVVHPSSPTKPLTNLVHNPKIQTPQPTPSTNNPAYYDILQSQSFMNLMNAPPNDYLLPNALPKLHPAQNIANLPNALSKQQAHLKNQQQTQSLQHLLSQHKKDFNAPDGAPVNNVPIIHPDPMQRILTSINMNHQPPVLPVPTLPQPTTQPQNSSFQSLMMQLHTMQKPHIMQQQIQQHHQQSIIMNALNSSTLPRNHHSIEEINQPNIPHQADVRAAHGLWDLPIPPPMQPNPNAKLPTLHNNIVPSSSMKTELEIMEHLKAKAKQDVTRLQHPLFGVPPPQQQQQQPQQQQQQQQQPPPQPQIHPPQQQQPVNPSPMILGNTPNDLLVQQSDMFRAKNENIKDIQSEALKQIGKTVKIKSETIIASIPIDAKLNQIINNNKINNNLIEPPTDELQMDKIDNKLNKAKLSNAANASKQLNDIKSHPKSIIAQSNDAANKSNINNINNNIGFVTATPPKSTVKESTKKKAKDKEQKAAEEKRRQLEEEERQQLEEKKRLELIAAQRKAKLIDQNAARSEAAAAAASSKRNNLAASVAPWSNITENALSNATNSPLTLTEIQKAERERRAELYRLEQAQQQTQALLDQQQQKESVLKWKLKPQNQTKSLAEIQAEESKARQSNLQIVAANQAQQKQQNAKKDDKWPVSQWSMIWGNDGNNSTTITTTATNSQSGNGNSNCFWEDPAKTVVTTTTTVAAAAVASKLSAQQNGTGKPLARSQTVSNMQSVSNNLKPTQTATKSTAISKTSSSGNVSAANNNTNNNNNNAAQIASSATANSKKTKSNTSTSKKNASNMEDSTSDEFGSWCCNKLSAHVDVIDVPTFVSFLRDIESPFEVKDYIRMYLGETKECSEFAKHFLERRSKYKNQQRAANAHIDDMCSPAPAITPANESQEAKGKGKKEKKKNKMTKLDSRILGFSVTSAEDRLNVGARDYARDGP